MTTPVGVAAVAAAALTTVERNSPAERPCSVQARAQRQTLFVELMQSRAQKAALGRVVLVVAHVEEAAVEETRHFAPRHVLEQLS